MGSLIWRDLKSRPAYSYFYWFWLWWWAILKEWLQDLALWLAIVEAVDVKLILIANRLLEVDVNVNEGLGEKWVDVVQWYKEWTLNSFLIKVDEYQLYSKCALDFTFADDFMF